jgi:hypothetical protein
VQANPYPSPINWMQPLLDKTNIDNALYFFRASTTTNRRNIKRLHNEYRSTAWLHL